MQASSAWSILNILQCYAPSVMGFFLVVVSAAAIAAAWWLICMLGYWLLAMRPWQKNCTDAARQIQPVNMGVSMVLPHHTGHTDSAPILPRSHVGHTAPSTMLTTPKSASGVRRPASPLSAENYSPKSK